MLSLRLVWTNTAYIDEATYLWAGHLEIAHWLHGAPVPPFQTWLSGAPVIYPPVAAVADSVGGLAGARLLSLALMTGATVLLWNATSRLFGDRAAFFAAALFAVLGPTQFLGALATYDAMALFLLAASAWCVVAARDRDDSTLLLVAGTVPWRWPTPPSTRRRCSIRSSSRSPGWSSRAGAVPSRAWAGPGTWPPA